MLYPLEKPDRKNGTASVKFINKDDQPIATLIRHIIKELIHLLLQISSLLDLLQIVLSRDSLLYSFYIPAGNQLNDAACKISQIPAVCKSFCSMVSLIDPQENF